jgi:hypothetical protein
MMVLRGGDDRRRVIASLQKGKSGAGRADDGAAAEQALMLICFHADVFFCFSLSHLVLLVKQAGVFRLRDIGPPNEYGHNHKDPK